jgi:hypothetical protein
METLEKKYFEINGTSFQNETKREIAEVLERCRVNKTRIILDYGHDDGKSWGETFDIRGYVGRSSGTFKVPILVYNSRSFGGGSILTSCIVQIKESRGGRVLYQHKKYKPFLTWEE